MQAGKLKIVVRKRADKVIIPRTEIISIREEFNTQNIIYDYQNLDPFTITTGDLYVEGNPTSTTASYIKIESEYSQNITTGSGNFELLITTNGISSQLDKTIPVVLGTNTVNVVIDFRSRPETVYLEKETPDWTTPVTITQQDILSHCSDFDGDQIVKWGLVCGTDPNFVYNGSQYVSGTMVDLSTIDALGFSYVPTNNPNGYSVEYPHLVQDSTGLITKI